MRAAVTTDPATTPVVVACCRTAIGRADPDRGLFRHVRGDELAAAVVAAVVERSGVDPATIEDVVLGVADPRWELGGNPARGIALMAGLPPAAAGTTVDRLAGSSLQALAQACHAIAGGAENVQVVAGVERVRHVPNDVGIDVHPRALARSSRGVLVPGLTAEHLAAVHGIRRPRQEAFTAASHAKAGCAADAGLFDDEIVRVIGHDEAGAIVEAVADQSIRRDVSPAALAALEPAFLPTHGTVTAATSAPPGDGAAALVVMSEAEAARQGLESLARVLATAVAGVPPALMGTGPIAAVRKLVGRVADRGITLADIDLVEIDEAFAVQALHSIDELGLDAARVNVRGGALAVGLPAGAGGARIATTLLHALRDSGGRLGLATTCVGLGQGVAVLFERV